MKKILLALVLIPSLSFGAGWDETVTSPQPDDTIMINDVSQPEGSKTQYSSLKTLPVPDSVTTQLNTKVSLSGDQTVNGIKNFTASPILPEPTSDSQAATKFYVDNNAGGGGSGEWGLIIGTLSDQTDLWNELLTTVRLTGSQSINGVKTFVLPPIVPTPVSGTDAVNKDYVDGLTASVDWGDIGGTLANQGDLNDALNGKAPALTADQNYVSDAELVILQQTEGVNTGDQDLTGKVNNTGDETIAGVKTFSSSPIVPEPETDSQAATKFYVDNNSVSAVYPEAGIPVSTGSAWGTSYSIPSLVAVLDDEPWSYTNDVDLTSAASVRMGPLAFEGSTVDEFQTTFSIVDPTASRAILVGDFDTAIPAATSLDATGKVVLAGMAANSVDSDQYVDGSVDVVHVEDDLKTNIVEWVFNDVSAPTTAKEVNALKVPVGTTWLEASSRCDATPGTDPVFTIYYHVDGSAALAQINTFTHDAAGLVDNEDITAWPSDPVAGSYIAVDLTTAATTATGCTFSVTLLTN